MNIPWQQIDHFGHRDLLGKNIFAVSWLLGRFCNYNCSYCWPHGRSDVRDFRSTDLILQTMTEIKRQARARGFESFHFSFAGGEPTLHPGFLEIVRSYVAGDGESGFQSLHMTSNCSPGLRWFEKFLAAARGAGEIAIGASFHSEFADRERFQEKMLFLQENGVKILVTLVMTPSRFEKLLGVAESFHHAGLNVVLKPQSNEDATEVVEGYTAEQLDLMSRELVHREDPPQVLLRDVEGNSYEMDHAERLNSVGFNKFTGWECSAGYRSIIIREPCGSIKRGHSCHDQPLGNISTGFQLFPEVKLCRTSSCLCSTDAKIPKRQVFSTGPLWPGHISC